VWPEHPPRDPRAWLAAVATRRLVDARRSEAARHRREEAMSAEPRPAATEEGDDTLFLLFCCCHPDLAPASQVALTLRNRRRAGCSRSCCSITPAYRRLDSEGRIVTLDRQDRGLWDTREIAEGVRVLQSALAVQRPGRYQVEAAIAALHDDAASSEETDWPQILAWHAVRGHLHELRGDLPAAATAYADAARRATDVAERDHLARQAARARASIKP
jgi:predicted RNA polymerase sigma factor